MIDQADRTIRGGYFESSTNLQPRLAPLDFISPQRSVELFQVVNLLLLSTAPEIAVGKQPLIAVPFHLFGDDEILPQTKWPGCRSGQSGSTTRFIPYSKSLRRQIITP